MHRARLTAALLSLATLVNARAAELDVTPVLVELSPEAPTALLSVRNAGERPVRLQLRVFAWAQKSDGAMELSATTDVAAYPALVEIPAGAERKLRLGATAPQPGPRERSYRAFIEELPPPAAAAGTQVQVLTRIGIPIFVRPQSWTRKPELGLLDAPAGRVRVALRNSGSVRIRPRTVRLAAYDGAGKAVGAVELPSWYVLAGGERIYDAALPAGSCPAARKVTVTAQLDGGDVETSANARCEP